MNTVFFVRSLYFKFVSAPRAAFFDCELMQDLRERRETTQEASAEIILQTSSFSDAFDAFLSCFHDIGVRAAGDPAAGDRCVYVARGIEIGYISDTDADVIAYCFNVPHTVNVKLSTATFHMTGGGAARVVIQNRIDGTARGRTFKSLRAAKAYATRTESAIATTYMDAILRAGVRITRDRDYRPYETARRRAEEIAHGEAIA